jgi:ketosteroid isomerase-like protein
MADFNARRTDKVCDLFAPDLPADFRRQPERNYLELCALLKRSLAEQRFSYALDLKEVQVFGNLAIVRLVWTLTVKSEDGSETTSAEPGLDVFRKQADGKWQIIRYMAYER